MSNNFSISPEDLERDELSKDSPSAISFTHFDATENDNLIDADNSDRAGLYLHRADCVSLIFLLVPNPARANQLCEQIEKFDEGEASGRIGQILLRQLVCSASRGKVDKGKSQRSILCALHAIDRYAALVALAPGYGPGRARSKKDFGKLEHFYLDPMRLALYCLCTDTVASRANDLVNKLGHPSGCWTHLETALLQLECRLGSARHLVRKIQSAGFAVPLDNVDKGLSCLVEADKKSDGSVLTVRKGRCLIISQHRFDQAKDMKDRDGTEMDACALRKTMQMYGCEVVLERDLKGADLVPTVATFAKSLGRDSFDYCCVCFLGHGGVNAATNTEEFYGVDGVGIDVDRLIRLVSNGTRCPAMIGKPKIFIIQACRGDREQDLVWSKRLACLQHDGPSGQIPAESEYIILHSQTSGYVSYRDPSTGSIFIQMLCKELNTYGHVRSVYHVFTMARRKIVEKVPLMSPDFKSTMSSDLRLTKVAAQ